MTDSAGGGGGPDIFPIMSCWIIAPSALHCDHLVGERSFLVGERSLLAFILVTTLVNIFLLGFSVVCITPGRGR